MARCERYRGGKTGARGEGERRDRKVHREALASGGVALRKTKPVITRGICSFSLSCSFTRRLPTVGLVASARVPSENLPRLPSSNYSSDPAVIGIATRCNPLSPRRRHRRCRCRLFLNFAVAAAGFLLRTNLNKCRACCAAASNYMVIQIIGDDYRP